jgi:hypothetical protein
MSGRPVHLLAAAAIGATASLALISPASAGCFTGCGSYAYAAPVAYYSAPVVYGYSYAAPCSPCGGYGYGGYGYGYGYGSGYATPSYVVNQGPAYTEPVLGYADPTPAPSVSNSYGYGNGSAYPMYSDGGVRWYRRHWGYRGYRAHGYRGYGYRAFGQHRYRYGAVAPRWRYGMRHPIVGPGGIYRPRHPMVGPAGIYRSPRRDMPGFVHPMRDANGVMLHRPMGPMPRHNGPMHPMPHKKAMP